MRAIVTNIATLNTGDAAILLATIDMLREAFGPELEVTVYDGQAEAAARYYPDIEFRPALFDRLEAWAGDGRRLKAAAVLTLAAARLWPSGAGRALAALLPEDVRAVVRDFAAADLVVSSGGTYLVPHYRLLPKLLDLLLARELGRPMVLFTQSLGPFNGRRRWLVRRALGHARLALVRDEPSRRHLADIGLPSGRIAQCADAAFALAVGGGGAVQASGGRPLRVAASVRDWPHIGRQGTGGMDSYLDAVAAAVDRLVRGHQAEVTFLSTCQGMPEYWTDDATMADKIVDRLSPNVRSSVHVDRRFREPRTLVAKFAEFDLVLATRMHAAILALCAGVPVVPIAYEFKTVELFRRFGLDDYVQTIEDVSGDSLSATVERALAARTELCRRLPDSVAAARRSAFEAAGHLKRAIPRVA